MNSGRIALLRKLALALCLAASLAMTLLVALVAVPLKQPPVLLSVNKDGAALTRDGLPPVSRFQARDGSDLAFRLYPASTVPPKAVAILVHGSSASDMAMAPLAIALATRGIVAYAVDIRGHGHSGTRGDIGYLGQLADDMEDTVAMIRGVEPSLPLVLIGHSAGGGFALEVAASPLGAAFDSVVLLAPYLGYDAPTSRASSGWDNADILRVLALDLLNGIGVTCCNALPALAFAVPEDSTMLLTPIYSYRLMRSFAVLGDARSAIARSQMPIRIYVGEDDELMNARSYSSFVGPFKPRVSASILPGLRHMTILDSPSAIDAIIRDLGPIIDKPVQ